MWKLFATTRTCKGGETLARSFTFDPRAYTNILGSTFASRDHGTVIAIGGRTWNRWQLGRLGCPHPAAAVRVQRIIDTLKIKTPAEFIARAHEFGHYASLGVTCYAIVLALVADCGGDIEAAHGEQKSFASVHRGALRAQLDTAADRERLSPREPRKRGKTRRRVA